ncbi:MAG TPA: XRE family transcriptional regulator [Fervidobacterium sp.]|nr:XRE family transcriptional regulator [Fervidobacterium sp.]
MIGEKIKLLRVEKGIKQEELAKALHVSQKAISHYETGRVTPPTEILKAIADYFGVTLDFFFEDSKKNVPESNVAEIVESTETKKVPLYSVPASAGNGEFPDELYVVDHVPVIHSDTSFCVLVHGDSMEPIAPNGSILLVHAQNYAFNGDMVIATYDGWVYVKWYVRQGDKIFLLSENPEYAPIVIDPTERFIIHGVVVDIMRGHKPRKIVR